MMYKSNRKAVERALKDAKKQTLEKIGFLVEAEAKLRTPVDTGTLRRSITSRTEEESVTIGTNIEYASHVEKGTSNQKPQPYLTPAVEENKDKIKDIVIDYYKKVGD